jgi:hypothetical protein
LKEEEEEDEEEEEEEDDDDDDDDGELKLITLRNLAEGSEQISKVI